MSTKKVLQDYGVQPFMKHKDESVVDFLQRATWFEALQRFSQKHSEMMQPWNTDYPDMEYGYPNLDGPPDSTPPGVSVDGQLVPWGFCMVTCWSPFMCDDPVECHLSKAQHVEGQTITQDLTPASVMVFEQSGGDSKPFLPLAYNRVSAAATDPIGLSAQAHDDIIEQTNKGHRPSNVTFTGKFAPDTMNPIKILPPSTGYWPHWPEEPTTKLRVIVQDSAGNVCETTVDATCFLQDCCQKSDYVAMTFDDASTPDTIAPGGSITVYVLNGCGPFVWSVVGAGYGFSVSQTSVGSNTLTLINGACGSGVGQAAAVGTVTVTDSCGTCVTTKIRSTAGVWAQLCTYGANYCAYDTPSNPPGCPYLLPPTFTYSTSDAAVRWQFAGYSCMSTASCSWYGPGTCHPTHEPPAFIDPACPTVNQCPPGGSGCNGGFKCLPQTMGFEQWTCP